MKKLISLILALCMLCAVLPAVADRVKQQEFVYEVPYYWRETSSCLADGAEYGGEDKRDAHWEISSPQPFWPSSMPRDEFPDYGDEYPYYLYAANTYIRRCWYSQPWIGEISEGAPFSSLEMAMKSFLEEEGVSGGQYSERTLRDGSTLACVIEDMTDDDEGRYRMHCMWIGGSLKVKIDIEYDAVWRPETRGYENEIHEDVYQNSVLPFLQSLRTEDGENLLGPAVYVGSMELAEVKFGNVTFQIPAELEWEAGNASSATYGSDAFKVALFTWPLDERSIRSASKVFGNERSEYYLGELQTYMQRCLFNNGVSLVQALQIRQAAVERDIGMLNGLPILDAKQALSTANACFSQTYRGINFTVYVYGETTEEAELIARDIMLSVRIDGVTEEDMIADAQRDLLSVLLGNATVVDTFADAQ